MKKNLRFLIGFLSLCARNCNYLSRLYCLAAPEKQSYNLFIRLGVYKAGCRAKFFSKVQGLFILGLPNMHCKNAVLSYTPELQTLPMQNSRICIEKSLYAFCLCINLRITNLTRMTEIWEPVWETHTVIVFFFSVLISMKWWFVPMLFCTLRGCYLKEMDLEFTKLEES